MNPRVTVAVGRKTETKLNHVVDDQWRYQCPFCDSHTIIVRQHNGHRKEYSDVNPTIFDYGGTPADFKCHSCEETFDRPYDKKQNERRKLHHIQ